MRMSPTMRRFGALGLLLGTMFLVWSLALSPLLASIAADRDSIAVSERLIARYDLLVHEAPLLERKLAAIEGSGGETALLDGANAVLVAAKMQSRLQQQAASAGVALRSSQTLPSKQEAGFSRIGLQLDLGANPATLTRLLHGIESSTPALFIETLSVDTPENVTVGNDPGATPLTVRLQVYGYMRGVAS